MNDWNSTKLGQNKEQLKKKNEENLKFIPNMIVLWLLDMSLTCLYGDTDGAPLGLKSHVCHFEKWQIPPFNHQDWHYIE